MTSNQTPKRTMPNPIDPFEIDPFNGRGKRESQDCWVEYDQNGVPRKMIYRETISVEEYNKIHGKLQPITP